MADNLRRLLIQRAARLQERPAFTSPSWGRLSYSQFRNRVEGVAMGLLTDMRPAGTAIFCATGTAWDWVSEVAAACCGLRWDAAGAIVDPDILGGPRFNDEGGRGPYHQREHDMDGSTLVSGKLDHAAMMLGLQRMNRNLGWDHETEVRLPLAQLGAPEVRAALWCALYAGAHAILEEAARTPGGLSARRAARPAPFDPGPFSGFWS
ncbi:MAG: hypothetical protein IPQ13_11315 [Holophagaceae bacterium]|nr:hypothetical protein [Holophagaceae bacterium]